MDITFGIYNLEYGGIDNGDMSRLKRQNGMLADDGADDGPAAARQCQSGGSRQLGGVT